MVASESIDADLGGLPTWYTPPESFEGAGRIDSLATGFPFRALTCQARYIFAPNRANFQLHSLRGGIQLSKTSDRFGIVPLTPIWSGLLLNIAIWSITAWLLLTLTSTLRTRLRTRRAGKCPQCRYDLRGLPPSAPCPECGKTIRSSHP